MILVRVPCEKKLLIWEHLFCIFAGSFEVSKFIRSDEMPEFTKEVEANNITIKVLILIL